MDIEFENLRKKETQANILNMSLLNDKIDFVIKQLSLLSNRPDNRENVVADEIEDVIRVKEAAKILQRSESTVYIKASKKEIPSWNDGGRLLFSRKALKAYVLENRDKEEKKEISLSKMKSIRDRYKKK